MRLRHVAASFFTPKRSAGKVCDNFGIMTRRAASQAFHSPASRRGGTVTISPWSGPAGAASTPEWARYAALKALPSGRH